jgi:hypothetical protein
MSPGTHSGTDDINVWSITCSVISPLSDLLVHSHTCYVTLSLRRRHIHFAMTGSCVYSKEQAVTSDGQILKVWDPSPHPPNPPHTPTQPSTTDKRVRHHFHLHLRQMGEIFLLSWMMLCQIPGILRLTTRSVNAIGNMMFEKCKYCLARCFEENYLKPMGSASRLEEGHPEFKMW